jgi:hypothetical protein
MVVAAGGFDNTGTVRLFRCPAPELSPVDEDAAVELARRRLSGGYCSADSF